MSPIHILQICLICVSIYIFSLFTYTVYYYDKVSSKFFNDIHSQYDFIIVGSGTAGSLIAHRIAKETNHTFILLEAGGQGHSLHEIPISGPLLHNSVFDWQYETVPQEHACFAMEEARSRQTLGKIVGGSSKLNNMIHVRGNISHYVEWFHGKYSTDYIQRQFDHIESNILHLNNIQYDSPFSDNVIKAAKELKFKELDEHFGIGFKKSTVSQRKGKRWTASDNLDKKNIHTNMLVEKLLIKNNKCIGVQINSPKKKIFAKRGVILSAGTYNSAKILQLSGIGPADVLKPLNISIVKELPVGKNLQDHIGTGLDLIVFDKPQSFNKLDIVNPYNIFQYFFNGVGPLTTPGCEVIGFVSTKNGATPDIQYMVMPFGISFDGGAQLRKNLGIRDVVWENYFLEVVHKYSATFLAMLLHPKSRGEVRIQGTDPNKPLYIDPKYLSHKEDIEIIKNGLKIIKTIIETESLKSRGAYINNIHFPGCENFEFFSDSYLECYVKHLTLTIFHPVGTCSMGLPGSNNSVVDTSFRVIGIDYLYVVDGSVLPTLPSGNINAAIAMMANIFFESIFKNINISNFCDNYNFKEYILNFCLAR